MFVSATNSSAGAVHRGDRGEERRQRQPGVQGRDCCVAVYRKGLNQSYLTSQIHPSDVDIPGQWQPSA